MARMPPFLANRWPGLVAIAVLFLLQALAATACGLPPWGLWRLTAMLAVPAVLLLALPVAAGTVTAVVVLLPFVMTSNAIECLPSERTDAAMGYVLSFLFGMPASLLAGLGAGLFAWRRKRRRRA